MKVEQLMTPDPLTVAPQTPVAEIARLLLEHRINGVLNPPGFRGGSEV
ncbi:MAG: CBS domain-containing protein [Acidithiobacillus sp.]